MKNDFSIEITKSKKLLEVNNSMCHNFYFLYYGRIYNKDKTRMRKFKFVEWADINDICDYLDKEYVTDKDIRYVMSEYAWNTCDDKAARLINSFDDCQEFYDWCNETIKKYNR